jgi:polysaccharide chain length determinant protein (PEP-CTERM system associated)
MNDIYQEALRYIGSIWRRRWYAIAIAWVVCGAGWTTVASLPDRYESSARIYVDMDTMLGPVMRGIAVEMNLLDQIDFMRRTLLSRPNLEKILLMTDLDLTIKNEQDKEKLIDELKRRIGVIQQGRNLFEIKYEDTDRGLAKRVVTAVMQVFVESNLGASRNDMESTQRFLENQIRDYERQLAQKEDDLAKFKRENIGLLPGNGNYYAHMQDMNKQLSDAEAKVSEATMVRDELRAQLADVPAYIDSAAGAGNLNFAGLDQDSKGPESDASIRILELQTTLDQLRARYTDKHPDVLSVKRQIEALQKQIAAQDEKAASNDKAEDADESETPASTVTKVPNPLFEQIKLQLVQQEGTIAALKSRAADARKQVEKWSAMAKRVPQIEAELQQKMRDYEIIKKGYQELRQRQEAAKFARDMETKARKVQFRIVDPPKQPLKPVAPNRPLLTSAVLVAGVLMGVAFAFLLTQINSTFSSVQRLRKTFTLPVLGRVTAIVSPRERRQHRRELAGFVLVAIALFIAFGGLLGIEIFGTTEALSHLKGLHIL